MVLLSADDLLVPGSLWRAAAIMEQHPNVGLVYGRPLLARDGRPFPEELRPLALDGRVERS